MKLLGDAWPSNELAISSTVMRAPLMQDDGGIGRDAVVWHVLFKAMIA
jgi:hypothetical protein